jgi:hypothetical protein
MPVNCVAHQDGRKLAEIATGDIGGHVSRPECFVWVAIPTLPAGTCGMNSPFTPQLPWPFGCPLAPASMVAIDAWLFVRFRRARGL